MASRSQHHLLFNTVQQTLIQKKLNSLALTSKLALMYVETCSFFSLKNVAFFVYFNYFFVYKIFNLKKTEQQFSYSFFFILFSLHTVPVMYIVKESLVTDDEDDDDNNDGNSTEYEAIIYADNNDEDETATIEIKSEPCDDTTAADNTEENSNDNEYSDSLLRPLTIVEQFSSSNTLNDFPRDKKRIFVKRDLFYNQHKRKLYKHRSCQRGRPPSTSLAAATSAAAITITTTNDDNGATRRYLCNKCNQKSYTLMCNLSRHQRVECQKEPKFQCPVCPNKFYYRNTMVQHAKVVHKVTPGNA